MRPRIAVLRKGTHSFNTLSALLGEGSFSPFELTDNLQIPNAVEDGTVDLGFVAVENSYHGVVSGPINNLSQWPFTNGRFGVVVLAEAWASIHHALITNKDVPLRDIAVVVSHPQALGQCTKWLRSNLPHAELVPAENTASAVMSITGKRNHAAIGSPRIVTGDSLSVLADHIEPPGNATRFLLFARAVGLSTEPPAFQEASSEQKAVIVVDLAHVPGSLHRLTGYAKRFQMETMISVPHPDEPTKKLFWVELTDTLGWHLPWNRAFSARVRELVRRLGNKKELVESVHDLGTYPVFRISG